MKLKAVDIVSLTTAFAAIIATVVAIITLNQNSHQLEYSINPDLMVKNLEQSIYIYKDHKPINTPFYLVKEAPANDTVLRQSKAPNFYFQIINVGRGTARYVELNWEYDWEYFQNHPLVKSDSLKVYQQVDDQVVFYESMMHPIHVIDFVDYVLPIDQEKTETKRQFPDLYLLSWSNIVYKIMDSEKDDETVIREIKQFFKEAPPLKLHVSCKNIGGKTLEKTFIGTMIPIVVERSKSKITVAFFLREAFTSEENIVQEKLQMYYLKGASYSMHDLAK